MIEAWFDGVCEPRNPGGHAAWGAAIVIQTTRASANQVDGIIRMSGYCGVGPTMSNNVAEYSGFIAAAEECLKYPGVVIIRGDSKLVVMQLNGKWKVNGGLYKPYYDKAKILWQQLKNRAKLEWIPRDENDICDVLSKKVLKDRGIQFRIQPE